MNLSGASELIRSHAGDTFKAAGMQNSGAPGGFGEILGKALDGAKQQPREDAALTDRLHSAAEAFESFFLKDLIKKMRGSAIKNNLVEESSGNKVFTDMLDERYSKEMAKKHVIGIADMITKLFQGHAERFEAARSAMEVIG